MINENEITKNYNSDEFFDRVKTLVKENSDFTLREFIANSGMNPENYYSLRRLNNFPRCNEAQRIADNLGVSLDYLVTGETKDSGIFPYGENVKKLLDDLFALREDQRDFLLYTLAGQIKFFQEKNK